MHEVFRYSVLPLLAGVLLDRCLGDPRWLPHPVVGFGKLIARGESLLNRGKRRMLKGGILAVSLILATFFAVQGLLSGARMISPAVWGVCSVALIFYGLAGTTLIREVRAVFEAADRSVEEGRQQVSRIVGRDTASLSDREVRTAALETLAENLSDGVVAPLFWYGLLGVPGMCAYKMVNTLDSMTGYKNDRFLLFGRTAARIDDAANYIPARLTAILMVLASGKYATLKFVIRYGRQHSSPNAGYPEAALAGILDCRFGGAHTYAGHLVYKPFIGENNRRLTALDMQRSIRINRLVEYGMVCLLIGYLLVSAYYF
ncbi:MAG: adenosylcobinamide-phosphate synthase CbiB [Tannerellaceae bacterium]|jgi:adenosylcobinamide-phosphate synthase|nr:adenosylcobinamide-phosphate synthase CbiB [Tannerellaceae bacterium]